MSKLLFPVIASIPRKLSQFDFSGRLFDWCADNSELVTYGGFPMNKRFSSSPMNSFIASLLVKISAWRTIVVFPAIVESASAYSFWISMPSDFFGERILSASRRMLPLPHVGSMMTSGEIFFALRICPLFFCKDSGRLEVPEFFLLFHFKPTYVFLELRPLQKWCDCIEVAIAARLI